MRKSTVVGCAVAVVGCSGHLAGDGQVAQDVEALGETEGGWMIPALFDVDGDGLADVIWSRPATSEIAVGFMKGADRCAVGPRIPGPLGPNWTAVTAADFNGDGLGDVPLFNPDTHEAAIYLLRGFRSYQPGPPLTGPPGNGWVAAAAGDVDGDGLADVVWNNTLTGNFLVWFMHGSAPVRAGPELPGPGGSAWAIATVADFDGDGRADLVWYNAATSRAAVWLARDADHFAPGPPLPQVAGAEPGWVLIDTAADFNGDGFADLIWNKPDANLFSIWLMRGACLLEAGPQLPGPPGEGWSVGSAGDVDGDGFADLVFQRRSTNGMGVVTMAGTHPRTYGPELPGP